MFQSPVYLIHKFFLLLCLSSIFKVLFAFGAICDVVFCVHLDMGVCNRVQFTTSGLKLSCRASKLWASGLKLSCRASKLWASGRNYRAGHPNYGHPIGRNSSVGASHRREFTQVFCRKICLFLSDARKASFINNLKSTSVT